KELEEKMRLEEERMRREFFEKLVQEASDLGFDVSIVTTDHKEPSASLPKKEEDESLMSYEIDPSVVKRGRSIGKGEFGEVFEGILYGKEVAVKEMKNINVEGLEAFKKEVRIMWYDLSLTKKIDWFDLI